MNYLIETPAQHNPSRFELAVRRLPVCIDPYHTRAYQTIPQLVALVRGEVELYETHSIDTEIRNDADLLECKRFINAYEEVTS